MDLIHFFQYAFIQKALIAGMSTALVCSTLGIFLVLRKMSLIGDGLAHVSFGAIALGLFFSTYPIYIALPIVMIASLIILKISEKAKVYGDAAIGIVSAIGIASGVIFASISHGFSIDLMSYLFGNILSITTSEVILSVGLSLIVLLVIYRYYWDLFTTTHDEEYAKTTGINVEAINTILTLLTAITVVLTIKMVGVMLVSALLIIPGVTALQLAKSFRHALGFAGILSMSSVAIGIPISFFFDIPSGATIVFVNIFFFILAFVYKQIR